jgi:hypothetical protein
MIMKWATLFFLNHAQAWQTAHLTEIAAARERRAQHDDRCEYGG